MLISAFSAPFSADGFTGIKPAHEELITAYGYVMATEPDLISWWEDGQPDELRTGLAAMTRQADEIARTAKVTPELQRVYLSKADIGSVVMKAYPRAIWDAVVSNYG
jgi:hypothetical protein